MTDRVAVVTGGIGGLGSEICRHLARAGRRVVAADLGSGSDARVTQFHASLGDLAERIRFETADVADFASCRALIEGIERDVGPVAILVNAAGITRDVTLRKMSERQWTDVLHVNLDSVFNMCRHVVDSMSERGFGRIVNISSVNGQTGQFGQTNYSAAKAGIHGFSMALAREVARKGVTVNSVSPGYCRTTMIETIPENVRNDIAAKIPVGRLCEPAEIARVIDFLTNDDAGYITGANIPVNGGYFMDF